MKNCTSKKQEIRSLRNDLLLHMALYSLAIVVPCVLLACSFRRKLDYIPGTLTAPKS